MDLQENPLIPGVHHQLIENILSKLICLEEGIAATKPSIHQKVSGINPTTLAMTLSGVPVNHQNQQPTTLPMTVPGVTNIQLPIGSVQSNPQQPYFPAQSSPQQPYFAAQVIPQ